MKNTITAFCITVILVLMVTTATAQTPTPTPQPALYNNIYAGGLSYNPGASPAIAGTGLYAHLISDGSGTYGFTVVDALPVSVKPFTLTTNFGAGIAQKIFTIGKVTVFVPTSAGISYSGQNTGWAWSTGGVAVVPVKGSVFLMPSVRLQKSSISNGAGYQPIIGLLVGFGK